MTTRLDALCWDAHDPMLLARFWAEALRWEVGDERDGVVELVPTDGTPFTIEFAPTTDVKAGQSRFHLDLTTASLPDQTESVDRLLALGARHLDIGQRPEEGHVVLADPEGNEFCLIGPDNNFLAGCPRLGSITCDGTQAVGYFWRDALGWPLSWDQDEETAIRPPDRAGPMITWGGPPLLPKPTKNRQHLHLAPSPDSTQHAEVERLVALGADRVDIGQGDVDWIVMVDPDGNEFCLLPG